MADDTMRHAVPLPPRTRSARFLAAVAARPAATWRPVTPWPDYTRGVDDMRATPDIHVARGGRGGAS